MGEGYPPTQIMVGGIVQAPPLTNKNFREKIRENFQPRENPVYENFQSRKISSRENPVYENFRTQEISVRENQTARKSVARKSNREKIRFEKIQSRENPFRENPTARKSVSRNFVREIPYEKIRTRIFGVTIKFVSNIFCGNPDPN